jgi:hypothetical protein
VDQNLLAIPNCARYSRCRYFGVGQQERIVEMLQSRFQETPPCVTRLPDQQTPRQQNLRHYRRYVEAGRHGSGIRVGRGNGEPAFGH